MEVSQLKASNTGKVRNLFRLPVLAAAAVAVMVGVAGCTAGTPDATSTEADGAAGDSAGTVNAVMIVGADGDPFFSKVKNGSDDVVAGYGGGLNITYLGPKSYDNLGPDVAKLLQTALTQRPDVVIAPDWVPDSQDPAFEQLIDAGIPVILYNAGGQESVDNLGAVTYIGNEEYTAGQAAGEAMVEDGAKHIVCVNTIPGSANIEARCGGAKEAAEAGGAKFSQLDLPSTSFGNPTAVSEAVKAALTSDPTIDGALAIGAADSDSVWTAIQGANAVGKVRLGCFDINKSAAERIDAGEQLFAVDQQPYLQGYLSASTAYQYVNWGILSPMIPNLTGPLLITQETAAAALQGIADGVR